MTGQEKGDLLIQVTA